MTLVTCHRSRNRHVLSAGGRPYSSTGSDRSHRDRLRDLLDAVVDADNTDVPEKARSSFASEFHFSREVRRLTGESPAALRRRIDEMIVSYTSCSLGGGTRVLPSRSEWALVESGVNGDFVGARWRKA